MNTYMFNSRRLVACISLLALLVAPFTFVGCKEEISADAYAIKTKKTLDDYLSERPDLSSIRAIFADAKLGVSDNASSIESVLSARGNYTVFAPNNDAVAKYVSLLTNGESSDYNVLTHEQKTAVALNCIIDNGSNSAYELADFPSDGMFATTNLRERRISCKQLTSGEYQLNDTATVIEPNLEASNGMLHLINNVIVPSDKSVVNLISAAPNMRIISKLLEVTGYADQLGLQTKEEEAYEKEHLSHAGEKRTLENAGSDYTYQSKRLIGYTAFVETDDVFASDWGITKPDNNNPEQVDENGCITDAFWNSTILPQLKAKCEAIYGTADADDLKKEDNALNKFMAYHLLDGKIVLEDRSAVHHWNEYDYECGESYTVKSSSKYMVDVWDYYTTKSGALLKITQTPGKGKGDNLGEPKYYINRVCKYNTLWDGSPILGDYQEIDGSVRTGEGLNVAPSNKNRVESNGKETIYENDGANGYYFPIDHVLVNGNATKDALSSERMRIDFTTFFPEILSNDIRGSKPAFFPRGYFSGITNESVGTEIFYLQEGFCGKGMDWRDYQGDEFIATGLYDLTIKLPRVPKDGMYELRLASSNNNLRGMVQIYLGESPNIMNPVGLPIDQRETVSMIPGNPWVDDKESDYDEQTCRENDRNLRNQGYMKAPQYFHAGGKSKETPARNIGGSSCALRRILTTDYFKANQTYYLRFKSAIPDYSKSQLFLDYIEFVPSSVYNGTEPEDVW